MKDIKIRIKNEEHSKKVQDCLFSLGYSWGRIGKEYVKNATYLYVYNANNRITHEFDEEYFNQHKNIESELITETRNGKVCTYFREIYYVNLMVNVPISKINIAFTLDDNGIKVGDKVKIVDGSALTDMQGEKESIIYYPFNSRDYFIVSETNVEHQYSHNFTNYKINQDLVIYDPVTLKCYRTSSKYIKLVK